MRNLLPRTRILLAGFVLVMAGACLPAQDWAKARLEKSPRHREYVTLKHDNRSVPQVAA